MRVVVRQGFYCIDIRLQMSNNTHVDLFAKIHKPQYFIITVGNCKGIISFITGVE